MKRTVIGCLKSSRSCCIQIDQIFRCTPARYQSPSQSVPVGTPGPGGPNSSPGVAAFFPEAPLAGVFDGGIAFDARTYQTIAQHDIFL